MVKSTFNWGIIGLGNIAHLFAQGLPFVEGAHLHAVASRSLEKAKKFAVKYDVPHYYGSYEEIIAAPELDIVYIATPHSLHYVNTLMCMREHISVLCEKPVAMNIFQLKRMIQTAEQQNVFFMEALWSRFLPHIVKLKELVEGGAIGKITSIKTNFGFHAPFSEEHRIFNPKLGGGSLLDVGIYPLFLCYFLMGIPNSIEASASFGKTNVDESCKISLGYSCGATADLSCSVVEKTDLTATIYGAAGKIQIEPHWYAPSHLTLESELFGEKQEFSFDYDNIGNGYTYEIIEAMKCMQQTQQQSKMWTWASSLELMQILDDVRVKCGIRYDVDE